MNQQIVLFDCDHLCYCQQYYQQIEFNESFLVRKLSAKNTLQ